MNEIKMSTKVSDGQTSRLVLNMDINKLGVQWAPGDIIRVISHRKDGMLTLRKVNKKYSKTVAHTLTKTAGKEYSNSLGIYVSHSNRRFMKEFEKVQSVPAACRLTGKKMNEVQVYIPKEIYKQA
jgi:hypothetical protein